MQTNIVLTITGPDKIGLVESVSKIVVDLAGNIVASRMAHLGGEFAMLMFIRIEPENLSSLSGNLDKFVKQGYKITSSETTQEDPSKYKGWVPFEIRVNGADHEGIIHKIAALSARG